MAFDFPASPTEGQMFAAPGGPLYVYNNPVWKVAGIATIPGEWKTKRTYVTATDAAFAFDPATEVAEVEVMGAGGGGGGVNNAATGAAGGGAGGNAGTFCKALFAVTQPTAAIVVGAAGTGGTVGAAGGTGGTSSFTMGAKVLTAPGGAGGLGSAPGAGPTSAPANTGGGVASGGDINVMGAPGDYSQGYGTSVSASVCYGHGGHGASTIYGEGGTVGAAITASGTGSGVNGSAGTGYGSGGAGASISNNNGTGNTGGAGRPGLVVVTEYFPAWVLDAAYPPGTVRETLIETTQAYNKPVGLKYLEVEIQAPGGAGGGAVATAATPTASSGSGGGSGAWGTKLFNAADVPASLTVTIGSPGVGAAGTVGSAGGTVSFGSLCQCTGGSGGANSSAVAAFTNVAPGAGGVASGFTLNEPGTWGGWGAPFIATGQNKVGEGAHSRNGFGAPFVHSTSYTGAAGVGYGSGGMGSCNYGSQTSKAGASGAPGFVKLKEYF